MLHEFAVEPSVLNSWANFQRFVGQFGVHHGRMISRYPSKWKKMVHESLGNCKDIERQKIIEGLRRIDDRLLPRAHDWQPTLDWLPNAIIEHGIRPFHAIIALKNDQAHGSVMDSDAIDETSPPPAWQMQRSRPVARSAAAMAGLLAPLLRICKEVVFIDPHFGPENGRHARPFEAFQLALLQGRCGATPSRIEMHTGDKAALAFFEQTCQAVLPALVPRGLSVRLVRWKQQELHNRFVLTDVGGVSFGQGLDEYEGRGPQEDIITLLDKAVCEQLMNDYRHPSETAKFTHQGEVVVHGTRAV